MPRRESLAEKMGIKLPEVQVMERKKERRATPEDTKRIFAQIEAEKAKDQLPPDWRNRIFKEAVKRRDNINPLFIFRICRQKRKKLSTGG